MSSNKPTSVENQAGKLPNRFKCSICEEYKNQEHFSNNELKTLQFKKSSNASLTGTTAKLRCRACTGSQRQEMECERCSQILDIQKFSKSSRKAGGNHWCIECTVWKESAAPIPADADNQGWETSVITEQMERATIASSTAGGSRAGSVFGGDRPRDSFATTPSFGQCSRIRNTTLASQYIAPHLRPAVPRNTDDENPSVPSKSNLYAESRSDTTSTTGDVWKGVDSRRRQRTYNAWGPQGQLQQRVTSGPSSTASQIPVASVNIALVSTTSRRGGWAKPIGSRTPQEPVTNPAMPAPRPRTHYDSDDSDDYDDA